MPRFVILEHDHPHRHFDLMLESGGVLWTWRLARLPQVGDRFDAERVFDHRLVYLDYEGPIHGDRGAVQRRDQGALTWLTIAEGRLEARVLGANLHALLRLTREDNGERWWLECVE